MANQSKKDNDLKNKDSNGILAQRVKEAFERKENENNTSKTDVSTSNNKSNKADTKDIEVARTRIKDAIKNLKDARSNPLGPIPDVSAEKALAAQYGLSEELNVLEKALEAVIKAQEEKIAAIAAAAGSSPKSVAEDLKDFDKKLATDPVGAMRDYLNDEKVKKNIETLDGLLDGTKKIENALDEYKELNDEVTSETGRYKRKALIGASVELDEKDKNSSTPLTNKEKEFREECKAGLPKLIKLSIHDIVVTKHKETLNKPLHKFDASEARETIAKTNEANEALDTHLGGPKKIAKVLHLEPGAAQEFINGPKGEKQGKKLKTTLVLAEMLVKRKPDGITDEKVGAVLEDSRKKFETQNQVVVVSKVEDKSVKNTEQKDQTGNSTEAEKSNEVSKNEEMKAARIAALKAKNNKIESQEPNAVKTIKDHLLKSSDSASYPPVVTNNNVVKKQITH